MPEGKTLIPEYGPFSGIRVLGTGSLIAMPFAASMLAEFGAQVIQIERPKVGDNFRAFGPVIKNEHGAAGAAWVQDARNRLSMTLELNLNDPDTHEIFMGLIRQTDIYMENMVWLEKLGIRDEELLRENPKLVIVHISGFGHPEFGGLPELCERASYDMIGQAFSGFALYNGFPDRPPLITKPSLNDYVTAMFAAFGALAAYMGTQKTGKGQVVDVAQFEAQAKMMRDAFTRTSMNVGKVERAGSRALDFQPWDLFLSKDNIYVAVGCFGPNVYHRFVQAAGFDEDRYPFEKVSKDRAAVDSPLGREFAGLVTDWCRSHTAQEIDDILSTAKVPCSQVNDAATCMKHPHFLSRNDFIHYQDESLKTEITALGVIPKLSETPGAVWRGAPSLGQDTIHILKELLGYQDDQIRRFQDKGII